MKLVAAKCPNCGAQIDVDKDSDSTKCEFCKSKIIVEDAIAKYKIEISGEVSIKNLPQVENLMKLADMHYQDREYDEAYNQYSRICELDPENYCAILRKGLCKTLLMEYPNFDIISAVNAMKNAYKILSKEKSKDRINSSILECNYVIATVAAKIMNQFQTGLVNADRMMQMIAQLRACANNQEFLYSLIFDNENIELVMINSMLQTVKYIKEDKKYATGATNNYGKPVISYYRLPRNVKKEYQEFESKYNARRNYIMAQKNPHPEEEQK